jgi:hypothetical protein
MNSLLGISEERLREVERAIKEAGDSTWLAYRNGVVISRLEASDVRTLVASARAAAPGSIRVFTRSDGVKVTICS